MSGLVLTENWGQMQPLQLRDDQALLVNVQLPSHVLQLLQLLQPAMLPPPLQLLLPLQA